MCVVFVGYTTSMDKQKTLYLLEKETDLVWDTLCELYPALVKFNPPKIKLNPYFWRTAGCCHQEGGIVELGYKFFARSEAYFNTMVDIILPHELIHQADYNLHGYSEKNCGHGVQWCEMMIQYGLEPNPFHNMEITRK